MHYVPKHTSYLNSNGTKMANITMYQEPNPNYYQKNSTIDSNNPPRSTLDMDNQYKDR